MANTAFDLAYFERMAALEDRHPLTRSMREFTFDLLARYGAKSGDSLLDAGCGTNCFYVTGGNDFRTLGMWESIMPGRCFR
jgi:hypothetical protein